MALNKARKSEAPDDQKNMNTEKLNVSMDSRHNMQQKSHIENIQKPNPDTKTNFDPDINKRTDENPSKMEMPGRISTDQNALKYSNTNEVLNEIKISDKMVSNEGATTVTSSSEKEASSVSSNFFDNLSNFVSGSVETLKKIGVEMISPFIRYYNSLDMPDTSKGIRNNSFSEELHVNILPIVRKSLFIIVLLISFGIIAYISFSIPLFFSKKRDKDKKDSDVNKLTNKENISLKGRVKKVPNNINYNELFVENTNKKCRTFEETIKNEQIDCNNDDLDEFFQKVKEKSEFEKIFNGEFQNKKSQGLVKGGSEKDKMSNIKNENLLIFYQYDNNTSKQYNYNKLDNLLLISNTKPVQDTVKIDQNKSKFVKDEVSDESPHFNNNKIDDEMDESIRIEQKKKNSDIFYQTPLARIKSNSLVNK